MTSEEFRRNLSGDKPPEGLSPLLCALWTEARGNWAHGDWDAAHKIVQDESGADAAWVHAYLHRREGDLSNARYWYGRAEKPEHGGTLEDEWAELVAALLDG